MNVKRAETKTPQAQPGRCEIYTISTLYSISTLTLLESHANIQGKMFYECFMFIQGSQLRH